jgi:hypothetical protein
MTSPEAKVILQALRPNDPDTTQPAFAEALALAESDPELKAWWEAQQEFDRKVVAKLQEIPIPDDLRGTIMAGSKIEKFSPQPSFSLWLAAAAVVGILCVAGSVLHDQMFGPQPKEDYVASVLPLLNHDAPDLAMVSPDRDKIMAWLKVRHAPIGTLPEKVASLPPVGCQTYQVHGHAVTLICFAMEGGGVAHLFMVNRDAMIDPPADNAPELDDINGWSTAAWSDGHMSYLLATTAGDGALKKLL